MMKNMYIKEHDMSYHDLVLYDAKIEKEKYPSCVKSMTNTFSISIL